MNETIKDLIVAIAEGDSVAIDSTFSSIMANKIADRLDDMRVSVAQNMFGDTPIMEEVEYYDELLEAGKKYGSQKAGERVAGAILAKLRK